MAAVGGGGSDNDMCTGNDSCTDTCHNTNMSNCKHMGTGMCTGKGNDNGTDGGS